VSFNILAIVSFYALSLLSITLTNHFNDFLGSFHNYWFEFVALILFNSCSQY
jgi:hypothetical protein